MSPYVRTVKTGSGATAVQKQKDARRNRYQIQAHLPPPEPGSHQLAGGEVLAILTRARPAR